MKNYEIESDLRQLTILLKSFEKQLIDNDSEKLRSQIENAFEKCKKDFSKLKQETTNIVQANKTLVDCLNETNQLITLVGYRLV